MLGRLLNHEVQKKSNMIHDLPRLWHCYDRVRGYALSNDRFQFIFDSKTDLQYVLDVVAWTYEDYSIVLDHLMEYPLEDYLQILLIWVRMENILVNHYTYWTIEKIGEEISQVSKVAFDPSKPQRKGYVRVQVPFDISHPLCQSKSVVVDTSEIEYCNIPVQGTWA